MVCEPTALGNPGQWKVVCNSLHLGKVKLVVSSELAITPSQRGQVAEFLHSYLDGGASVEL